MKLIDLAVGDRIRGFEGFGCIPDTATRRVARDEHGLFVKCCEGRHYLDGQEDEDGNLVGITKCA